MALLLNKRSIPVGKYIFLLSIIFVASARVAAQNKAIDTDRPDQTETTTIVPLNRFQMENGFTHKHNPSKGEERYELPSSLWKFGLCQGLEFRLLTSMVHESSEENTLTGLEPVTIGAKIRLYDGGNVLPEISVIGQFLLPDTANKELSLLQIAPEVRLLFQNQITEKIDLGYNAGLYYDGETNSTQYAYTFSPCFDISEVIKAYIECYGFLKTSQHPENWVDGGFMMLIGKDIQLDISAGYELTSPVSHKHGTYESIGVSFRI